MKLQGKAILAFNILLAVACVIVGVLGYFTADHGFGFALKEKAVHDLEEINAVLEARYPGAWESKPDGLYKGGKKFNDDNALLDELGQPRSGRKPRKRSSRPSCRRENPSPATRKSWATVI